MAARGFATRFLSHVRPSLPFRLPVHTRAFTTSSLRFSEPPTTARTSPSATQSTEPIRDITQGLADEPLPQTSEAHIDWTRSFQGLSLEAFPKETADALLAPIPEQDIEVKPDGIIFLPEIKYRRVMNRAFGPGGWGLAPRGETIVTGKSVTREYALLAHGRYVCSEGPVRRGWLHRNKELTISQTSLNSARRARVL